jgi:hypothetical protein
MRCKRLGGLEKKDLKDGRRTERVSWIAALKGDKVFAPMTFEGLLAQCRSASLVSLSLVLV